MVKNKFPKILIIGSARHGKDSMAEILNSEFGLTYQSSSQAAANIFIYDELKDKYNYKNPTECFEDRMNHRQEWYEMICNYNKDDRARLAKEILEISDCYVGMRDDEEFKECINQNLFDIIIWVDASERLPKETNSFNIEKENADVVIDNNNTFDDFYKKVLRLGRILI